MVVFCEAELSPNCLFSSLPSLRRLSTCDIQLLGLRFFECRLASPHLGHTHLPPMTMIVRLFTAADRIHHLIEVLTYAFLGTLFILAITILAALVILGAMGTHSRHSGEQEEYLAEALRQHQKRWAHMRRMRKAEMKLFATQQQRYRLWQLSTSTYDLLNKVSHSGDNRLWT